MERRLVKHGPASIIVVIPSSWAKDHNLQPGDTVRMQPDGDKLIISPNTEGKSQEITISSDGLDRTSLKLLIRSLYRQGYTKITVRFKEPELIHFRLNTKVQVTTAVLQEVPLLIGVEVTEKGPNHVVIQEITKPVASELQNMYRKSFTMVHQMMLSLSGSKETLDIEAQHDLIMKFISYAMRIINRGEATLSNTEKIKLSNTFSTLGVIIDILKYYARAKKGASPSASEKKFINGLAILFSSLERNVFTKEHISMHDFERQKQDLRDHAVERLISITDLLTDLMVLHASYE